MSLKEKAKNLPSSPGVYLMKDSQNSIIYVGKSKNLKSRVGSYFQNSKSHSPKVAKLVKNIKDFEHLLTDTEFEAFMLECKLIKKIKPTYNKKMKSPLSYTYIKIKADYSDIEISSDAAEGSEAIYFGPYTNKNTVDRGIQGIKECCKIQCSGNYGKASPCLNYSLGSCIGMCFDESAKNILTTIMSDIIKLLNCTDRTILDKMELYMEEAAEILDFDTAAKYRDYITAVNYLVNNKKIVEFAEDNKNIVILELLDEHSVKFFLVRGAEILLSKRCELSGSDIKSLIIALRNDILCCLKNIDIYSQVEIGRNEIDESQIIYSYLKSNQNNCKYTVVSEVWINDEDITSIDKALGMLFRK